MGQLRVAHPLAQSVAHALARGSLWVQWRFTPHLPASKEVREKARMRFSQAQEIALCHSISESTPATSIALERLFAGRDRDCDPEGEDPFFHGVLARGSLRVAGDRTCTPLVW